MAKKKIDLAKGIVIDRSKHNDVYVEIAQCAKLAVGVLAPGQKLSVNISNSSVPMNKIRYRLGKALARANINLVPKTEKDQLWLELPQVPK